MATTSASEPPIYHGLYTSLYKSLSPQAVEHLERAIWLKKAGEGDTARKVYDNELAEVKGVPVVVAERADLELDVGRWGQAYRILNEALEAWKDVGMDLDLPEYRMMRCTRAMLGVRHRGDVITSAQEIGLTIEWLHDMPVDDYTDVHAGCVNRYILAYLFTKLHSNYDNPSAELIPKSSSNDKPAQPWDGLHELRRSLVARGMFLEANGLFRVELNRTPLKEREPILDEFLRDITGIPVSRGRYFIESAVRLQACNSWFNLHEFVRAKDELDKSEAALTQWCDESNVTANPGMASLQSLLVEKLNFIADSVVKMDCAVQIADLFDQTGCKSKIGSCLSTAAESAFAAFQKTGKQEYFTRTYELHERLLNHDEFVTEDLCDLVVHRHALISITFNNMTDRQKSLEWVEGFLKQYPHFATPTEMEILHGSRARLLKSMRRMEEAEEAEKVAEQYSQLEGNMGKWVHLSALHAVAPNIAIDELAEYDSEDEDGVTVFYEWRYTIGDDFKTAEKVGTLLLDWAYEDFLGGRLTTNEFCTITNVPEDQIAGLRAPDNAERIQETKEHAHANMCAVLFASNAESEAANQARVESTITWLQNYPKGQRNKRLYCLLMLRTARQAIFSTTKAWELCVAELMKLLELFPTLPKLIRGTQATAESGWLCALAMTCVAMVGGSPDLEDPTTYARVLEAEKWCNAAIEEVRRRYLPGSIALQQRLGAEVCILKIRRLERQLKRLFDDGAKPSPAGEQTERSAQENSAVNSMELIEEISRFRSEGLERLKETDQIFTAIELESSWADGIASIDHRQHLSHFHGSYFTTSTAVTLLLTEPEPSQETINEAWMWVQKDKARALTRTIGVRTHVPPSLLQAILASPEARSAYEEMLDLIRRVENANPGARFDLRQQLDAHRKRMKEQPLLQELISLREGTPLAASEIATIEKQAGRSIVLVDWYYLAPFPDDAEPKLLLFTARKDSEITMDVLSTSMEDVRAWQRQYLDPDVLCDPGTRHIFDAALGGLIAPLLHRTHEDELLILCPSDTLHRLPLHALPLPVQNPQPGTRPTQALIRRNPVVYLHSHTLLRACFSAADAARLFPSSLNARFLAGIPASQAQNFLAGRTAIADLARTFDTAPLIDRTASKPVFLAALKDSRLLHLHTHCGWDLANPLDHHVVFADCACECACECECAGLSEAEAAALKLTAKEIFELDLLPGTHVNLIACQGGVTEIKAGDEVMGLVPALLHSGATSTVSTLWSIRDGDGAVFSRGFFESFVRQCAEGVGVEGEGAANPLETLNRMRGALPGAEEGGTACFVDVAVALQDAVKEMDPYGVAPLSGWAAYVLHGFWRFAVPEADAEWLGGRQL